MKYKREESKYCCPLCTVCDKGLLVPYTTEGHGFHWLFCHLEILLNTYSSNLDTFIKGTTKKSLKSQLRAIAFKHTSQQWE